MVMETSSEANSLADHPNRPYDAVVADRRFRGESMRLAISLILTFIVGIIGTATCLCWPQIKFYQLTGHLYPIRIVEGLSQPIAVAGWKDNELRFADGRSVMVPGFRTLPEKSDAIEEATKRGVEITSDGRVIGLVRIHHWCGNDPVREHLARIDISEMLLFLGVGEPDAQLPPEGQGLERLGGTFSRFGWTVDEFLEFEFWQKVRRLNREGES
jgi:hypothetical protein